MTIFLLILAAAAFVIKEASLPSMWEAQKFPDWIVTNEYIDMSKSYISALKKRKIIEYWREQEIDFVIRETEDLLKPWYILNSFHYGQCPVSGVITNPEENIRYRREILKSLKESIGDKNFYLGQMPYPIPLHRVNYVE